MKPILAGILVPLALLAACGGGTSSAPDIGVQDVRLEITPLIPSLDTEVSTPSVKAGQTVQVTCLGEGFDPTQLEVVVREADSAQPPPVGDATPGEDASVGEPDVLLGPDETPDVGLPQGVTREGLTLKFTRSDVFTVACYSPEARLLDRTPVRVVVRPAGAATVETVVEPTSIKAGETVTVTCTGVDAYGNPLETPLVPLVKPPTGTKIQGLTVQITATGSYEIACTAKDTAIQDLTPVTVEVGPNLPKRIVTTVVPETFEAGASATLTCRALDYYDNPVTTLPLSVQVPEALTLDGKSLLGTLAGLYTVKCIPEIAEWKYFTLVPATVTVVPGAPAVLTLSEVPRKTIYGRNESLTVTAEARDAFGNLIPDAEVQAPIEINPANGIVPSASSPTRVFQLKEEGSYRMTFRLAGHPTVFAELEVKVDSTGPLLTLLYPERGTTHTGAKPAIEIKGMVNDDVAGIKSLKVNGKKLSLVPPTLQSDGTFTYILGSLSQGVNVVTVEVTNELDLTVSTTRGFQYSPLYYPSPAADPVAATVAKGAQAFLSREFVDDGDHSLPPDDLATILEMVVSSLNLAALLPNPLAEAGPYKVTIPSVTYGRPTFQLNLYDGGLHLVMIIPNVKVDIQAEGRCQFIIDWCPDVGGNVTFDTLTAFADVDLGMDAQGQLSASMKDVQVLLGGMEIHIDGLLGTLLDGIINLIVDAFRKTLTDTLVNQVSTIVNETLSNLLNKLVIDQSFEIPALPGGTARSIQLNVKPSTLGVRAEGIDVALDGTISAAKGITHNPLGSIGRASCLQKNPPPPAFKLPWDQEVVIGAFDDLLNQALFAVWYGGSLNLKITSADLGSTDLVQYGVEDLKADLDFYEAPILTDCTETGSLQAQVGDLYVWADLVFLDNPLQLGLFVQAAAEASLYLTTGETGKTAIAVRLDDIPILDIEIVSINQDFVDATEITKEDLMEILKGQLLDKALEGVIGKELVAFELPSIDMSSLSPSLPQGLSIEIGLKELSRKLGYTIIKGLLEQPAPAAP